MTAPRAACPFPPQPGWARPHGPSASRAVAARIRATLAAGGPTALRGAGERAGGDLHGAAGIAAEKEGQTHNDEGPPPVEVEGPAEARRRGELAGLGPGPVRAAPNQEMSPGAGALALWRRRRTGKPASSRLPVPSAADHDDQPQRLPSRIMKSAAPLEQ